MTGSEYGAVSSHLLSWYRENRRILPWREEVSPYRVWISEIMLQQTRVEAVKGYFERFLETLPTVSELAAVPDETLMKLWQGLGYYTRARNLKKAAMEIVVRFDGKVPDSFDDLLSLPGIGRYTAAAISSIAFGHRHAAVDGNVLRVYARVFGDERDIMEEETKKAFAEEILRLMPDESGCYGNAENGRNDCGDFTQALIELGATVCLPNGRPMCASCPLRESCFAWENEAFDRLPVKTRKADRRVEQRTLLFLSDSDGTRLGLMRRPDRGLLAGLFEPVNLAGALSDSDVLQLLSEYGVDAQTVREILPLGEAKHVFTHVEWHMTGYRVVLSELPLGASMVFPTTKEITEAYAVPSAFRYYMKKLIPEGGSSDGA